MDDIFLALEAQHGFIARRDLLALGLDDRDIRRFIDSRRWVRVRQGAYCHRHVWQALNPEERHRVLARAVLRAHGDAVVLSHVSGSLFLPGVDVWGIDLRRVHVVRRDGRSGGIERDVIHHEGVVRDEDVVEVDGIRMLRGVACLAQTLAMAGVEQGLVVADSALHAGAAREEELWEEHRGRRRERGNRTRDMVLRLADGRAESPGESRSRFLFWRHGFPKPQVQYHVYDRSGELLGITDLGWPMERLLFEFDGKRKYGRLLRDDQDPGEVVFSEKLREDLLRRVSGCAMERATWVDLDHPDELARRTRSRMRDLG